MCVHTHKLSGTYSKHTPNKTHLAIFTQSSHPAFLEIDEVRLNMQKIIIIIIMIIIIIISAITGICSVRLIALNYGTKSNLISALTVEVGSDPLRSNDLERRSLVTEKREELALEQSGSCNR